MSRSLAAAALLLALGCEREEELPNAQLSLVQDLSMLARAEPMDEATARARAKALASGTLSPDALVAGLLSYPELGTRVARPLILGGGRLGKDGHPVSAKFVLSSFTAKGETIYTLYGRCAPADAVRVSPWWAPAEEVLVCPDTVRAEVRGDDQGRSCGATTLVPDQVNLCGCGPRLIYCARDDKHLEEMKRSTEDEVEDTVAWVVNNDIPLDELFMMNETVRDRNAELVYRRARIVAGEPESLADLEDYTDRPKLTRREEQVPGQHAGVLTMPAMIYRSDALRGVMRDYYEILWCTGQASSKVTTAAVLGLDVVDLRVGAGWKQLAAMDICTDCHARLDYGMQFFHGYPSSTQGIDFRPADAYPGVGPLYGQSIHDPRGEDDLSPQGFARLATEQPEFGECMAKKVTSYVFSGTNSGDDYDAVLDAFEQSRTLRAMLQVAMERYAERALQGADSPPPESAPPETAPPAPRAPSDAAMDTVQLSPWLKTALDEECTHCHDGGTAEDLSGSSLSRDAAQRALEQVAFGTMPLTPRGLDQATRRSFVNELTGLLWSDPESVEIARAFFNGGFRAYPVHDFRPSLAMVASRAGGEGRPYMRSVEIATDKALLRYSPGFATATAVTALKICREAGLSGDDLRDCVAEATAPAAMVEGGVQGR